MAGPWQTTWGTCRPTSGRRRPVRRVGCPRRPRAPGGRRNDDPVEVRHAVRSRWLQLRQVHGEPGHRRTRGRPDEHAGRVSVGAARTATPLAPKITRIVEAFVHGEDIRRPLGIVHEYSTAHIGPVVQYFTRDRMSGGKARLDGLTLTATDADLSVGSGPVIEGPAISLLLAAAGRKSALTELSGPGVKTLGERD